MSTTFKYDPYFQSRIIAVALSSEDYIRNLVAIIESKYFTTQLHAAAWATISKYYMDQQIRISPDTLCMFLKKLSKFSDEQIEEFRSNITGADLADAEIVVKEAQNFCQQAAFLSTMANSLDDVYKGKFDVLYDKMQNLFSRDFTQTYLGMDYFFEIGKRYIDNQAVTRAGVVSTGLDLDEAFKGGLGAKEIGLIMGPTGRGKTALLLNLAYAALRQGKNVVYASCELSEDALANRMDNIIMSSLKAVQEFLPADLIKTLRELQTSTKSKLMIKEFPAGELSVPMLHSYIKNLEAIKKFHPDVVFVDYVGEMKLPGNDETQVHYAYKNLVTMLRGLAWKLECPLWTAHQSGRGSHDKTMVRQGDISDSFGILKPCDIVISMSATPIEFMAGYQRLTTLKNRFGPTEMTTIVKFNGATQRFTPASAEELQVDSLKKAKEVGATLGMNEIEEI